MIQLSLSKYQGKPSKHLSKSENVIIPDEPDISSIFDIDDPDVNNFKEEWNRRNEAVAK